MNLLEADPNIHGKLTLFQQFTNVLILWRKKLLSIPFLQSAKESVDIYIESYQVGSPGVINLNIGLRTVSWIKLSIDQSIKITYLLRVGNGGIEKRTFAFPLWFEYVMLRPVLVTPHHNHYTLLTNSSLRPLRKNKKCKSMVSKNSYSPFYQ